MDLLQTLAELYHGLDQGVADLKAQIQIAEKVAKDNDPGAPKLRELSDVIEALKLIRKHGSHEI